MNNNKKILFLFLRWACIKCQTVHNSILHFWHKMAEKKTNTKQNESIIYIAETLTTTHMQNGRMYDVYWNKWLDAFPTALWVRNQPQFQFKLLTLNQCRFYADVSNTYQVTICDGILMLIWCWYVCIHFALNISS